jgi:hypothetical protein
MPREVRPPGSRLHELAELLLDASALRAVVEPTIADLQYEAALASASRWTRTLVVCRGHVALAKAVGVSLLLGRLPMRTATRIAIVAATSLAGLLAMAEYLPLPLFLFLVSSVLFVLPLVVAALAVGARWSLRRTLVLAGIAVPLGYIVGSAVGWTAVPGAWRAPLAVTIDATMNAAKYGGAFEDAAENVVLYLLYGGILGALLSALAVIVAARVWAWDPAAGPRRSWRECGVSFVLCLLAIPLVYFNFVFSLGICFGVAVSLVPAWQHESALRRRVP